VQRPHVSGQAYGDQDVPPGTPAEDMMTGAGSIALRPDVPSRKLPLLHHFKDATNFIQTLQSTNDPELVSIGHDLITIHQALKARKPARCSALTISAEAAFYEMLSILPTREQCEELINLYFENFEHSMRILHRSSFMTQHNQFWETRPSGDVSSNAFVPCLIGVLSIAASLATTEACLGTDLHGDGSHHGAVFLMRSWLEGQPRKGRKTVVALQVRMLTMLPQKSRNASTEDLWTMSSQIVREAMSIALHRDPASTAKLNVLEVEVRRRLWMSIIEQDLSLAILCNMPATIPPYITKTPSNLDDVDLEGVVHVPSSKPDTQWTDALCQYVLSQSFPQRLAAYTCMYEASHNSGRYMVLLQHIARVEEFLRQLPPALRFGTDGNPGRLVARIDLDITIRRLLLNMYSSMILAAPNSEKSLKTRIEFTQSSLVLLCYQDLFDPKFTEVQTSHTQGYWDYFYNVYRHEINQTTLGLCLEIERLSKASIAESPQAVPQRNHRARPPTPSGSSWTRSSLVHALDDTLEPMIRRIARSGASVKDLATMSIVSSTSQKAGASDEVKLIAMKGDLRGLMAACKSQLQRDNVQLPEWRSDPLRSDEQLTGTYGDSDPPMLDFDILLTDILDPSFDLAVLPDSTGDWYTQ